MGNAEQVALFRSGSAAWNQWRKSNPDIIPDLSGGQFGFIGSRLHRYSKPGVSTSTFGRFTKRDHAGADLSGANLSGCIFREVVLDHVNFTGARLTNAEFRQVSLAHASLREAHLMNTTFILTAFSDVDFEGAVFGQTHFGYSPLSNIQGLDRATHAAGSHIDFLTLRHSSALPEGLVQHFGVAPAEYAQILRLRGTAYPDCFISYSTKDDAFVRALRQVLISRGVPCWFAPSDYRLNAAWSKEVRSEYELGRDLFNFIDAAEVILLVLSPHSLLSDWVDQEMIRAHAVRRTIPLLLADVDPRQVGKERTWYDSVVRTGVLDFRDWTASGVFQRQVEVLLQLLTRRS